MRHGRLPVLWLCGPMGVGKSAVGWALYAGLAESGAPAGFVGRRARLRLTAERAAADADALDRCGLGDLRVDTGALSIGEAADQVRRLW